MYLKLGGKLEIGDPILVSYSHGFIFGLFAGNGIGTIQFYTIDYIIYHYEDAIEKEKKPKFWKNYVHGNALEYRVAKVTKDVLYNDEDIEKYERAIEILKLENIIK
jgi:hypothetical protein